MKGWCYLLKIDIIGSVASGKTTLARLISRKLNVPYYEKDNIVWKRTSDGDVKRSPKERDEYFNEIVDNLLNVDPFMVLADFDSYRSAQVRLQRIYNNRERWGKMCLMNIANSGKFSADRAIDDYAQNIWHISKIK